MNQTNQTEPGTEKSHVELLHESQLRSARRFRTNVSLSWGFLFLFLVFLFSGQNFLGIKTIKLDFEFIQNNVFFYTKDLSKRANFKVTTDGQVTFHGSKKHFYCLDRLNTRYIIYTYDMTGRVLGKKKFDLGDIGLSYDMISSMHFSHLVELLLEVYDGRDELH